MNTVFKMFPVLNAAKISSKKILKCTCSVREYFMRFMAGAMLNNAFFREGDQNDNSK